MADPRGYAQAMHNLGVAYTELATGDRGANLEQAIACYTEALRFRTAEADPNGYAQTQHNLGGAYAELLTGDRGANLEQAISCYTEALRFRTAEAAPLGYAMTQNNLGSLYAQLPTGDRGANLERAIASFTEALRFRTAEAAPLDYAITQNGLGAAYAWLPTGDRASEPGAGHRLLHRGTEIPHRRGDSRRVPRHEPVTLVMSVSSRVAGRTRMPPTPQPSVPGSSFIRPPAPRPGGKPSWG